MDYLHKGEELELILNFDEEQTYFEAKKNKNASYRENVDKKFAREFHSTLLIFAKIMREKYPDNFKKLFPDKEFKWKLFPAVKKEIRNYAKTGFRKKDNDSVATDIDPTVDYIFIKGSFPSKSKKLFAPLEFLFLYIVAETLTEVMIQGIDFVPDISSRESDKRNKEESLFASIEKGVKTKLRNPRKLQSKLNFLDGVKNKLEFYLYSILELRSLDGTAVCTGIQEKLLVAISEDINKHSISIEDYFVAFLHTCVLVLFPDHEEFINNWQEYFKDNILDIDFLGDNIFIKSLVFEDQGSFVDGYFDLFLAYKTLEFYQEEHEKYKEKLKKTYS